MFKHGDFAFGFYLHLLAYCAAVPLIATLVPFDGSRWPPLWPLLGWAVGLALHALGALVLPHWRKARRAARRRSAEENYRI